MRWVMILIEFEHQSWTWSSSATVCILVNRFASMELTSETVSICQPFDSFIDRCCSHIKQQWRAPKSNGSKSAIHLDRSESVANSSIEWIYYERISRWCSRFSSVFALLRNSPWERKWRYAGLHLQKSPANPRLVRHEHSRWRSPTHHRGKRGQTNDLWYN